MGFSSSNIKKILIFPKMNPCTSQSMPKKSKKKEKKNLPEKNPLQFSCSSI